MPFQEMIAIVEERMAQHRGVAIDVDRSKRNPRIRISSDASPERWAEIELDDEVFFLRVDAGFQLVASELWAPEQAELLVDLADVATEYLHGSFRRVGGRRWLGGRWNGLGFNVNGSDYILKQERR